MTVVLGLAYWYWTTTPTYALSQIVGAVRNKDTETFEKYVDVETIAYRAIDDVLHGPARESGMFGNFDSMIGAGIVGLFKPEIAEIAKTQVLKFIESGQLTNAMTAEAQKNAAAASIAAANSGNGSPLQNSNPAGSNQGSAAGQSNTSNASNHSDPDADGGIRHGHGGLPDNSMVAGYAKKLKLGKQLKAYGLSKQGFKGIDYLKIEGQTALIGFKFHSEKFGRDIIIEIKMEEQGGYWRVTELSNLNALITIYLETRDKLDTTSLALPQSRILLISMS